MQQQLQDLRDAVRVLTVALLEPGRFTFDLHLLSLGLVGADQSGARAVVALLLGAARGESVRTDWPTDAPRPLRRFAEQYRPGERIDRDRAVALLSHALDVHADAARLLLDAHRRDGKGTEGHLALDGAANR